jgi:hypothetical protein
MQTEFEFTLPRGYLDPSGRLHRQGVMRLATALDEITPLGDARIQANPAYLPVMLLQRVIIHLGDLPGVSLQVLERLFSSDLAYLEDLYLRLNSPEPVILAALCPYCSGQFNLQVAPLEGEDAAPNL